MNWQHLGSVLSALLLAAIPSAVVWFILGAIGYNRMGPAGIGIAAFPAVFLGLILFLLFKHYFYTHHSG